jgi:hypothetical protein
MEELGITEDTQITHNINNLSINILYIKITLLCFLAVGLCVFCKNYKIDNTRRYRGKIVSFV